MNKHFSLYLVIFLTIFMVSPKSLFAQREVYRKIKIYGTTEELKNLALQGICMDHGESGKNSWFSSYFSPYEFDLIKKSGLRFDVLIEDARLQYKEQYKNSGALKLSFNSFCPHLNEPSYPTPSHFKYGSMGGFLTYSEMLEELDSMSLLYPDLITVKQPIAAGTTWDGNTLYFVKISDSAAIDQSEPEVYYSALHHAREPLSMQQLIYFMWYLLENYQTDSLVKTLVDQREMYFVPCVNPDGYLYNESTDPFGGGFWRKNRRDNLDGTYGVDLNRNYETFWGFDNFGSSPNTQSDVYRGISPFSETETQMVRDFINSREFVTAMDYHTYGNHVLYPYSHLPDIYTPDSAVFVALGETFTAFNDYTFGTCNQTLNYVTNGGSIDWQYEEQTTKEKIFDFTPELGYDFWPSPSDIIPIIQNSVHMSFMSSLVAGKYAKVSDRSPILLSSGNGYIHFDLLQLGLDTTGSYIVSVTGLSPQITGTGNSKTFSNLNFMQNISDSISYTLNAQPLNGTELAFLLTIDYGTFQVRDTLIKYFGTPLILINDKGNNLSNWSGGSGWGLTTSSYYSAGSSFTDSPLGNYDPVAYNELNLANPLNLTQAVRAGLSFYAKWQTESNSDYVEVRVSDDGGLTYTPLCGKYTQPGTSSQNNGLPLYDAVKTDWVKEEMSLNDYTGKNILIQFLLVSDGNDEYDGFYFDDFEVWSLQNNVGINETMGQVFLSEPYPNPSNNNIQLAYSIPDGGKYELIVYNKLGQQVLGYALDPKIGHITMNFEHYPQGVYYCKLVTAQHTPAVKKIMIIR